MNIKKFAWILVVMLAIGLSSQAQKSDLAPVRKDIALEDIWMYYKFVPAFPSEFNWMKDDNFYSVLEKGKIDQYKVKGQQFVRTILDIDELKDPQSDEKFQASSYVFSDDESKILLKSDREAIYRRSSKEVCRVWDSKAKKLHLIHGGAKVSFGKFSPDASRFAYMHDNDLYYYDFASGTKKAVTSDGEWGKIINGGTDWVYEEEYAFTRAFFWSPDNQKVAYYRFDESHVKEFSMVMYGELYPNKYDFKYPKAGEENAFIDLYIYDTGSGKQVKVDLGSERDIYIPRVKWTKSAEKLAVMRMNRLQNTCDVLMVDAATGKSKVILSEKEETYVEQPSDNTWIFLEDGKHFLWQSERDGHNHLYLYDLDGQLVRQLTKGDYDVSEISAVDEQEGQIYFMSTFISPLERHLYRVDMEGGKPKLLTKEKGWHNVSFSSGNTYYMDTYSTITTPAVAGLYDKKGKQLEVLEDNAKLKKTMDGYNLSTPEFMQVNADGQKLNAWMIKPPNFDKGKKYPVFMYVYGGPGSQTVKNQFLGFNYLWHQMLAGMGYIVVSVDGRGTGGRGEDFKKVTYGQLGKYETEDQVAAAKYLGTLPYVDANRIGIWGWSYGGYMTSLCLTKGGGVFKMGIAVAPVTTWRFYDTIYTERYLSTPQKNPSGYDDNSPIQFADKLEGKYLLVHGTADDNVHFQNSVEMVDALVNANKQFDMHFYPNKNHGIFGGLTRFHLYRKMTDFIQANL